ncbi:hypothetical protein DIE04_07115 [Burkholderia sp. Bp8994]|uniref:hypothetical protein n=1 Tax=unclassified Burkholderia TaxID=2613784 RepID=UPI000F5B3B8E|nr:MULTISPECIES: hypothetical protein [unclassified Burkholderia]RQS00138.1 hypothetical protein DIE04_07115 [Burkholderia sp. Bp8994]RQS41118.1 hypothetical protein DIE01_11935 [Burkholderia sp. Bp8990]RQZ50865.1 hypothetical protein DIE17_03545 [Burkholderia sp. Bp9099]
MREDAIQLDLLEDQVDLDDVSFGKSVDYFSRFLQNVASELHERKVFDGDFLKWANETLEFPLRFQAKKCSSAELLRKRVETWQLHDAEVAGQKKSFLRAVVCCLYEEKPEEGDEYEVPDMLELFFSVLLDIEPTLCQRFRVFFEAELRE